MPGQSTIRPNSGSLAVTASTQYEGKLHCLFEPSNFNVTEALIANGVNVSAIPDLASLTEKRSLSSPCAAAVSNLRSE
jgi:hypothetical protein